MPMTRSLFRYFVVSLNQLLASSWFILLRNFMTSLGSIAVFGALAWGSIAPSIHSGSSAGREGPTTESGENITVSRGSVPSQGELAHKPCDPQGYNEWKQNQIALAKERLEKAISPGAKRQAEVGLAYMFGLSFREYAAVYVKSKNPDCLKQIAQKLSWEEVSLALQLVSQPPSPSYSSSSPN